MLGQFQLDSDLGNWISGNGGLMMFWLWPPKRDFEKKYGNVVLLAIPVWQ